LDSGSGFIGFFLSIAISLFALVLTFSRRSDYFRIETYCQSFVLWYPINLILLPGARLYKKLSNHVQYRLDIAEAGGKFDDSVKIWNTALIAESTEIPAFLLAY